mgnify:CR=1 FL=1
MQSQSTESPKACETCGNVYEKSFEIILNNNSHHFDCFECAIQALAPECAACDCRIIGHGVELNGVVFCCVHCSKSYGESELKDNATVNR